MYLLTSAKFFISQQCLIERYKLTLLNCKGFTTRKKNYFSLRKDEKNKSWVKKMGWATIIFFIAKGTISTLLFIWAGSQFSSC
jgi:hypothetical protein